MYSAAQASPFGRSFAMAQAYRTIGVETSVSGASPHRLVELLFDGFMDAVSRARGLMRDGDIEGKGKAIGRAARIVEEGLKAGLNLDAGGELAADLQALYDYVTVRLTQANLRSDEKLLDECVALIEPLRSAWKAIGPAVADQQKAA